MAGKKSSLPPLGWRIFLSIIFIMGFYIVFSMVTLHFFGQKTVAILDGTDMTRVDYKGDKDLMNRISVSYHFYENGKEYRNSVVYRSGEILTTIVGYEGPRTVNIRYLKAFPYISNLEKMVSFEGKLDLPYCLMAMALFLWLFCFINGISGNRKKSSAGGEPQISNRGRITMAYLVERGHGDYDELVEEYYAKGWDKGDPSWRCSCGHWSEGAFCHSCGRRRGQ